MRFLFSKESVKNVSISVQVCYAICHCVQLLFSFTYKYINCVPANMICYMPNTGHLQKWSYLIIVFENKIKLRWDHTKLEWVLKAFLIEGHGTTQCQIGKKVMWLQNEIIEKCQDCQG